MLSGRPPVDGARYRDAATATPVDLWDLAPHVSRGVRDITMRALARDPGQRFPDPAALAAALGKRNKPRREWTRVVAHAHHERCLVGTEGGKSISLCVLRDPAASGYVFEVRYTGSGRRHAADGRACSSSGLNQAIRSCIRAVG